MPQSDPITEYLIGSFFEISRTRGYTQHSALPINVIGINAYCDAHPCLLSRDEFDKVMYALDHIMLDHWKKK